MGYIPLKSSIRVLPYRGCFTTFLPLLYLRPNEGVVDVIGTESPYRGVVSAYRESSVLLRESSAPYIGVVDGYREL